jgi:hypothetical protein
MRNQGKLNNITESARPERKASKRLAADLLRFESAFDKLERGCMGLGAIQSIEEERHEDVPEIAPRDVHAYLGCLDEAIRQLAEEFSEDATVANVIKKRDVSERDAIMPTAGTKKVSTVLTVDEPMAEPVSTPIAQASQAKATAPRKPNCAGFDFRPCDAGPIGNIFSQVDTSAV